MPITLKDFNCIISGGTGGLGQEVVTEFVNSGANVTTNYRNKTKFETLKGLVSFPENLFGIEEGLTTEKSVGDFFQEYTRKHKRLDVFIHLLGGFWMGEEIAETPLEKWEFMINLNLLSTFLTTREAFKMFKNQCCGKIFTVSAKSAVEFPAKMGAYAVSKAAVLALTRVLANEGKPYGIQVNSILPSVIDTLPNRKAMPQADYSQWVTPKQVADLLIGLCKPEVTILSETALKIYGKM